MRGEATVQRRAGQLGEPQVNPLGGSSIASYVGALAHPPGRRTDGAAVSPPSLLPVGSKDRLLLLPTLNEEAGLLRTLEELLCVPFRPGNGFPSVAVVDGSSTDGTLEVAQRWGVPVVHQLSKGKGAAVREALTYARSHRFSKVAVMDADATYPVASLPGVYDLLDNGADLVVGIRRPDHAPMLRARDMVHRVGNGFLNFLAGEFSGRPVLDVCSGFWGVGADRIPELDLRSDGFEIESELFIKAFQRRWRVAQLPVTYRSRLGQAKLRAVHDGSRILLSILRHARTRRPPLRAGAAVGVRPSPLTAILLAMGPERISLLAAPGRLIEAQGISERLRSAIPQAEIKAASVPEAGPQPWDPEMLPNLTTPSLGIEPPIAVLLPPTRGGNYREYLIGIPRTERFVRLLDPKSEPTRFFRLPKPEARPFPGFRREHLPIAALTALFILSATIEPSWRQRELALLSANASSARLGIFRKVGRRPLDVRRLAAPVTDGLDRAAVRDVRRAP
jgi:dolichol-phosphate hexosyltransferase